MLAAKVLRNEDRDPESTVVTATAALDWRRRLLDATVSESAFDASWPTRALDKAVSQAVDALVSRQREDGHWVFELEADATIPASFILLQHYLGNIETDLQQRLAAYLRYTQGADGGWPLFHDGDSDLSASVKAYFALKAVGDPADVPHME